MRGPTPGITRKRQVAGVAAAGVWLALGLTMALHGTGYDPGGFGEAGSIPGAEGTDDDSTPEPHLPSQQELYVLCVDRVVEGETERHWLCPLCDTEEAEVVEAVAEAAEAGQRAVCTKEWLKGRYLIGTAAHDLTECECFETEPYTEPQNAGRSAVQKKFFLYWAIAKELGASQTGDARKHTRCVMSELASRYGESRTGYRSHAKRARKV